MKPNLASTLFVLHPCPFGLRCRSSSLAFLRYVRTVGTATSGRTGSLRTVLGLVVVLIQVLAVGWASAQPLTADPTRPPPGVRAASAPASAASDTTSTPQPQRPRLQGVRLGREPSALINGQLLRPGQRWQGLTLVRVESHHAWLRDDRGRALRLSLIESNPVEGRQP